MAKHGEEIVQRLKSLSANGPAIEAQEKLALILERRKVGITYEKIGEELGMSAGHCCSLAKEAMRRRSIELGEDIDFVKGMELERLDALMEKAFSLLETAPFLAMDRILKLMQHRANLLGLEAPKEMRMGQMERNPILERLQKKVMNDPRLRAVLADLVLDEVEPGSTGENSKRGALESGGALEASFGSPGSGRYGYIAEADCVDATPTREE